MYEDVTFEEILERILDRIPDSVDKREGSIIYDAIAPAALELAQMYIELDVVLSESFGDSASRDYLIRRAAERGIKPTPATKAIVKGEFNVEVGLGTRFNLGSLNYVIIEPITQTQYKLQCESFGRIGNQSSGTLIPIDYVDGLESAKVTELLIPGEDEEETEAFRKRYFDSFESKAYGGNVDDYLNKTNSIAGVGATKVTPVWNGGGTVKLTILNSEFEKASTELIQTVQKTIDPKQDAKGVGIAPIGHIVTVDTVQEVVVNITTSITFQDGHNFNAMKQQITNKISEYLLEIRKEWAKQDTSTVRIAQIEAKIVSLDGIVDIENTKINGSTSNLILTKYQVPKMGGVANG